MACDHVSIPQPPKRSISKHASCGRGTPSSIGNGARYRTAAVAYTWRKSVPNIQDAEKWVQERHSDPVTDKETSLPGASLGVHCHKDGLVPRIVRRHPYEHSVGRKPQDNYNVPNENQITEVRHTLLQRGTSRVLSQRSGNPLTPTRFFHGTIPSNIITGNNHNHWVMVQEFLPPVHPDSSKRP